MLTMVTKHHLKRFLLVGLITTLFMGLFGFSVRSQAATIVSRFGSTAGKNYLEVDGKPFNPLAVQLRVDRMLWLDGKTLTDTASYYPDAKRLGFNTILIPLPWSQMEPQQNTYDWTWLNSFIDNSYNSGLKLEVLWFGTNVAGGGCTNFLPTYISGNPAVYVKHINSDGSIFTQHHAQDGDCSGYSLADPNTLSREEAALQAIMDHLAIYDTHHTTIGIQVNNESAVNQIVCVTNSGNEWDRSYDSYTNAAYASSGYTSGPAFAEFQLVDYQNKLASIIKNSNYVVYTRMNLSCANSNIVNNLKTKAPNIDFWGYDPYSTDTTFIRSRIDPANKWLSISENGPYANSPNLMLAAYDMGAIHYGTYQLVFEISDTDYANRNTMVNLDHSFGANALPTANANKQLAKDSYLTTYVNRTNIAYYHVNDNNQTVNENKAVGGTNINFSAPNWGYGLAVKDTNNFYLMGFNTGGTFKISYSAPTSISDGYFDANHNWVSTGSATYTKNSDGSISVTVGGTQYIRLNYGSAITPTYYKFRNRNTGQYMNMQNNTGKVEVNTLGNSGWWSAQWALETTDSGYLEIRNRNTGQYLHIQDNLGYVEYGTLGSMGWWSAQWKQVPTDSGYIEFDSRWQTNQYIHIQDNLGYAESGALGNPGWWSAQWMLEPVSNNTTPTLPVPTNTPTFVPPTATPQPTTGTTTSYDDANAIFQYMGSGWHHGACTTSSNCYANTNSWDNTTNDSVTVTFTGTQIKLYGVKDTKHGIGAVSIDGGAETSLDFYAATRAGNQLMWTSPTLASGSHTFKLRVTGTKNASSTDKFVVPDRLDVVN